MKYSVSIKRAGTEETFTIEGCNSFEEALKVVERGIYDRELQLLERMPKIIQGPNPKDIKVEVEDTKKQPDPPPLET